MWIFGIMFYVKLEIVYISFYLNVCEYWYWYIWNFKYVDMLLVIVIIGGLEMY